MSPKSTKYLAIAALFMAVLPSNEAQKVQCDPKHRPPIANCYQDAYKPVCGYYTENCPFSICASPQSSACYACADSKILYHEPGECKPSQQVDVCASNACDANDDPFNALEKDYYKPVCGIQKKCGKGDCDKTFGNVCTACNSKNIKSYPFFQNGPCESEKVYCPKKRPASCSSSASSNAPVCAFFTDADKVVQSVTVSDSCSACKDPAVNYYLPGACGKPLYNQTYCLPNSRPGSCTKIYDPVCGFYKGKDGSIQHKVIPNSCVACAEKDILYHTPGPCVFYCDRNPFVVYDCAGNIMPVCGSYKENGVTKKVSFRNSCLGCYYNQYNIESWTEGLCPGDNGILCKNNGGAFMDGFYEPVCGLTSLNCNSASCRKTYPSSISACGNANIVKYIPGLCPGDNGVSCADFRKNNGGYFEFGNVCGFTKTGKSNYKDVFAACKSTNVLYWKGGSC